MKPILNHHTKPAWSWNLLISPPWSQFSPASWNQTNQTIPVLLDSAAFKNIFKIWYQSQITMIERIKGPQAKKKKTPKTKTPQMFYSKKATGRHLVTFYKSWPFFCASVTQTSEHLLFASSLWQLWHFLC